MRQYYGDCPNCGGKIILESDGKYYCESCGTSYAPDLNRQEVEAEKRAAQPQLQKQAEDLGRQLNQDKVVLSGQSAARKQQEADNWKRGSRISKLLIFGFIAFFILIFGGLIFFTNVMPVFTASKRMDKSTENITNLTFSINNIEDLDKVKKDSEELVLNSDDGNYKLESAELLNIYLAMPISTTPDHNSLLLFYKVKGTFGSDNMDGELIRVVCINNIQKEDNKVTSDDLIGEKIAMSDTLVGTSFETEDRAFNELIPVLGRNYRVEALYTNKD